MSLDDLRLTFFQECEELLEQLSDGLQELSGGTRDDDTVNAIFRAVHSIKGGAGAFGLSNLVNFAHTFETMLDQVRSGKLEASDEVVQTSLRSSDILNDLVAIAQTDGDVGTDLVEPMLVELNSYVSGGDGDGDDAEAVAYDDDDDDDDDFGFVPVALTLDFSDGGDGVFQEASGFEIAFAPLPSLYDCGGETVRLLRALEQLGTYEAVCHESLPADFDAFDPMASYLSWNITLETDASEDDVAQIFEFFDTDCTLEIKPMLTALAEFEPEFEPEPGVEPVIAPDESCAIEHPTIEVVPKAEPTTAEKPKENAAPKPKADAPRAAVRVDLERVERLINLVGELVINQAVLSQQISDIKAAHNSEISSSLDEYRQLTRNIQESVMAIRAQPIKPLFQRMARIVREASQATGKQVEFVTEGENAEVDRKVVEQLADPLTHMIRNAVDHGLEAADERVAAGKSPQGRVTLSAAHRSGRVVIEVSDNGGGINREGVLKSAIGKGLIPEDVNLSDQEIDNLLFLPGFSTAEVLSDLSGRGVGMDVVKRAIQSLGGRITINSQPQIGSVFSISLPLTMAVLDGIVVQVGHETLVVSLSNVIETLKPVAMDMHKIGDGWAIRVRGEFVPVFDVANQLGFRERIQDFTQHVILLCETDEGCQGALVVDDIHDQRQVVIKGLDENYGHVDGIAAATILGDGRIALILDVESVIAESRESALTADPARNNRLPNENQTGAI